MPRKSYLKYFSAVLFCLYGLNSSAVEYPDSAYTIVEAINNSGGTIFIMQPLELNALVGKSDNPQYIEDGPTNRNVGYRVQVFSDNNMRTAKANAEYRKRMIEQQTGMRAYLTFDSPYWRVRVGDFRSQSEADAAMRELKEIFPNYSDDFRLVRERINAAQ